VFGLARNASAAITVQYPEERLPYPDTYRGRHRLTLKDDGSLQCTACFLCATACPAECIYIEAGEYPDRSVEKFPIRYDIDTLTLHLLRAIVSKPARATPFAWTPARIRATSVSVEKDSLRLKRF